MSNSVLDAVRSKYPEYQKVDDDTLTKSIGEKYPQYLNREDFRGDYERVTSEQVSPEEMADVEHKANLFALQKKARLAADYWAGVERRAGELMPLAEKEKNPLTAALNSASELLDTTLKAVGIVPKEAPPPAQIPTAFVSPEQATKAVQFFSPTGKAAEGTAGQGAEEFIGETLSGLTGADPALQIASGKYIPSTRAVVAKSFAGQMATAIPQATEALAEAQGPKETTKAALGTALSVIGPLGAGRVGEAKVGEVKPREPITGEALAMPKGATPPPIEARAAEVGPATAEAVKEQPTTGAPDARTIRGDEGQVLPAGNEPVGGEVQGGTDLQRQTPPQPGNEPSPPSVNAPELVSGPQGEARDTVVSKPLDIGQYVEWTENGKTQRGWIAGIFKAGGSAGVSKGGYEYAHVTLDTEPRGANTQVALESLKSIPETTTPEQMAGGAGPGIVGMGAATPSEFQPPYRKPSETTKTESTSLESVSAGRKEPTNKRQIQWNRPSKDEPIYDSVDGRFSITPLYIGSEKAQSYFLTDNHTKIRTHHVSLSSAQVAAERILNPNFKVERRLPFVAGGTKDQITKQLQENYDYFKRSGKLAQAETVRKNAESAGIQLNTGESPPIVGMGGAVPSEFEPVTQTATGIKNATVDRERTARGLPPAMQPLRRTFGTVWDEAMAEVDRNPERQDALIDELRKKPRALTDLEDALILHRQVDLQNEFGKATRDLAQAYDDGRMEDVAAEKMRVNALSDKLLDLYNIGKKVGTETGRGLAARKMMVNEDFSLAKMEMETRASKGGRPLTDGERAELKELHEKIAATQKAFDDYRAEAERRIAELEAERATKEMVSEAEEEAKGLGKGMKRGGGRSVREKALPTPEDISAGLRDAVGEGTIFEESGNWIRKLAEAFVRSGIKTRDPLIDAVHRVVEEIYPGVSRRSVMDAISGYGDFKPLNKDQIKAELRDLKGQMQQVAKLEDMQAGMAPAKTGVERRIPSDEERRLIKLVNEMKKKGGFVVTDPERQLRTALDAIKTRLKNQIKDLEYQIATGEKIVKKKGVSPSDTETEALVKQRDELKAKFEEVFGKPELTDEQRVKLAMGAVERSIADLEERIRTNDIGPRSRASKTPVTPELEAARARRDALREELKAMRDMANPKKTPEEIALASMKTRLKNRTAELMDKIARGDFATKPRKTVTLDAEAQRLKAENERWKRTYLEARLKDRLERRTAFEKMADTLVKWRRGFILSGPVTLAKLTSAAVQRMTITPLEESIGFGLGKIPGISTIAEKSPIEARLSISAESKALAQGFSKGMKDAAQVLKTGQSELDLLYGKIDTMPKSAMDFFGQLHGALKAPTKRNAFERAMAKQFEFGQRNGVDVTDPMVQMSYAIKAYREANRSIFMQDNRVVTAWKRGVAALEERNKATGEPTLSGKAAAATLKVLLPIVKVPTNIVAETMQYALGSVSGSVKLARAFVKGVDKLTPDEADSIMRHLKKGSIGAAVMLLGYYNADVIGGYYQPGQKRQADDVKFGSVRVYGQDVPSFLLHNPLLETLQLGATIRRVSESKLKKKDPEEQGLFAGLVAGGLGLLEEVPFLREMTEIQKLFNPREQQAWLGEFSKSLVVPQLIQTIANATDKDEWTVSNALLGDETTKRAPTTIIEHVKTGIPGLRQTVDVKPQKRSARK